MKSKFPLGLLGLACLSLTLGYLTLTPASQALSIVAYEKPSSTFDAINLMGPRNGGTNATTSNTTTGGNSTKSN